MFPAARIGDPTVHGGVITTGFPMVLIGNLPAARVTDIHTCPLHVGGPILTGSFTVLVGYMPQARMMDQATCVGPPDIISMGAPTVIVG